MPTLPEPAPQTIVRPLRAAHLLPPPGALAWPRHPCPLHGPPPARASAGQEAERVERRREDAAGGSCPEQCTVIASPGGGVAQTVATFLVFLPTLSHPP